MLGLVINTKPTDTDKSTLPTSEADTALQMAYVAQQRLNGYAEAVAHATQRKSVFDKKVLRQNPGEVIFSKNQLVQIYRSDLDFMFKTEHKLLPKWSTLHRVVSRNVNSYVLKTLNGNQLLTSFSARRLWRFLPKVGTKLAEEQKALEEQDIEEEREGEGEEQRQEAVTTDDKASCDTTTTGQ